MIVEDHLSSLAALTDILRIWGWEVESATTVGAAVPLLENPPAVILLDLMLPDGDGSEILNYMRSRNLTTPVIVTTGASDPERLERVKSLSPMCILKKPIDLDRLQECLDSL